MFNDTSTPERRQGPEAIKQVLNLFYSESNSEEWGCISVPNASTETWQNSYYRLSDTEDSAPLSEQADIGEVPKTADLYFTMARLSSPRRLGENFSSSKAVWLDIDKKMPYGQMLSVLPLSPSVVIESSPDKWHVSFFMDRLITDPGVQKGLNATLIANCIGADESAKDPTRVMRLPGGINGKPQYNGFEPGLVMVNMAAVYTEEEIRSLPNRASPKDWQVAPTHRSLSGNQIDAWYQARPTGEMCEIMRDRTQKLVGKLNMPLKQGESAHYIARDGVLSLAHHANEGGSGVVEAEAMVRQAFYNQIKGRNHPDDRRVWGMENEFDDLVAGAPNKTSPANQKDQCACDVEFTGVGTSRVPAPHTSGRKASLLCASDVKHERTVWLWEDRIPVGEVTFLAGRGGLGKSTVVAQLIAWLTTGVMRGEFLNNPQPVIVVINEDSLEKTVVPRLTAAGANLDLVHFVQIKEVDKLTRLQLPHDIDLVRSMVREVGAKLVFFDPLSSNLSGKKNEGDAMRPVVEELKGMAEEEEAAVLGLAHLRKGVSADIVEAMLGSSELGNVARSVMGLVEDTEAEEGEDDAKIVLLSQEKSNLASGQVKSYRFRMLDHSYPNPDKAGEIISTSKVKWLSSTNRKASEVMKEQRQGGGASAADSAASGGKAFNEAAEFLAKVFSQCPDGVKLRSEVVQIGTQGFNTHSESTLNRVIKAAEEFSEYSATDPNNKRLVKYWGFAKKIDEHKANNPDAVPPAN